MRDITFGQFYPTESFLHKLDPRMKILLSIVYIVLVLLCSSYLSYALVIAFLIIAIIASRVPLKSILKSLKAIIFLIIITVVINVLFYGQGRVLFSWWRICVTLEGLIFASKMALRLLLLVLGTTLVTLTTTPMNLTDGLESLLTPLKWIKIPVHDIALIMNIALRFIPCLMEEIDKIIMAQKARGADFDTGNLIKKAQALLPILIPLFVSAFRRADELALALDARCYNATPKRTKMKKLSFSYRDIIAAILLIILLLLIIFLKIGFWGLLGEWSL